jgi:hypothetical protein
MQLAANVLFWWRSEPSVGLAGEATQKVDELRVPLEPIGVLLTFHALSVAIHFLRNRRDRTPTPR